MKINISDITKINGAVLDIEFHENMENLNSITDGFIFDKAVSFHGQLVNNSGVLSLNGKLHAEYSTKCYRCLTELEGIIESSVREDFIDKGKDTEGEAYTYEGNFIDLDKVLQDNIILNLPARQVCSNNCKGLCNQCGSNLNEKPCECSEEVNDPRMEVLKNFFNKS
jgi:uncharacterized protein